MGTITLSQLRKKKQNQEKIVMVTAYDYISAQMADQAGVDMILVGDSVGTVVQGRPTTLSVTLDQMIYHAEMVVRATEHAMVIVDMPFPYCQLGPEEAVRAAARIIKETGASGVKIEGGGRRQETIQALVEAGIPVIGHCGLMPQSIRTLGGYRIQRDTDLLCEDARAVEQCGVFAVLLECVPKETAAEVARMLAVPVIGIGAGNGCDGQVLVFHDLLGYTMKDTLPRHARAYAHLKDIIIGAIQNYAHDVRTGRFPDDSESF